jgi:hypothetical protein
VLILMPSPVDLMPRERASKPHPEEAASAAVTKDAP